MRSSSTEALRKYRERLDARLDGLLREQALRRLFEVFDADGDQCILPGELLETRTLLAKHFGSASSQPIYDTFARADANSDGKIDWVEFKESHVELLEAIGAPSRDVLNMLNEIEALVFQDRVRRAQAGDEAPTALPGAVPFALASL